MDNWEYRKIKDSVISRLELELPDYLTYHDPAHTIMVTKKADFLASLHSLNKMETELIKIAALYHDIGFIVGKDDHEEKSCLIAKTDLELLNFDRNIIEEICEMILATKIPQAVKNISQQILADADLFYLGTELYDHYSTKLYQEIKYFTPELTQSEWLDIQIDFMQQHQFHTHYGKSVLTPVKVSHLNRLKKRRKQL